MKDRGHVSGYCGAGLTSLMVVKIDDAHVRTRGSQRRNAARPDAGLSTGDECDSTLKIQIDHSASPIGAAKDRPTDVNQPDNA